MTVLTKALSVHVLYTWALPCQGHQRLRVMTKSFPDEVQRNGRTFLWFKNVQEWLASVGKACQPQLPPQGCLQPETAPTQ